LPLSPTSWIHPLEVDGNGIKPTSAQAGVLGEAGGLLRPQAKGVYR